MESKHCMSESYCCYANSDHSSLCVHHINKHMLGQADGKYSLQIGDNHMCVCVCVLHRLVSDFD